MSGKPIVYTIAGSDCSGGAGLQADLLTLHALGVHACTLTTALTAQNRHGVQALLPTSTAQLRAEFAALFGELKPSAIKLGMLATAELATTVTDLLTRCDCPVICDPVLSASAGGELLSEAGLHVLRQLLPRLTLLTPNAQEAAALSGLLVQDYASMANAAERLLQLGAQAVLITGGDLAHDAAHRCDYFASHAQRFWLQADTVATPHTHGTGCTLASAIAAFMAQGHDLRDAVVLGKMVITEGLRSAQGVGDSDGAGSGAVAHPRWREVLDGGLANLPRLLPQRPDTFTPL
ncbi:MAG: bifunctional hydroxymethylpyrimidine kinase/phosphomethylpyrimidine kinase, partial [Pseudomonadales bacterium]|nr:bifunctional hydroxymethylpyrimidine kinase/phosphomethylpyrimidine kinase [Pseudomonadales bacterium]